MGVALVSLIGVFVSAYLYLYKIGKIGTMACGTGSCETVQLSEYAVFLGIDVPLIGLLGYGALFAVALAGLQPRWRARPIIRTLLIVMAVLGVLFSAYLTYVELFVIHAVCRWCVGSAVMIVLILILALVDRGSDQELSPTT